MMQFTEQDREALYNVWMPQKAKMRITQMEMAKKLGLTQVSFSELLRGGAPLNMSYVSNFCRLLHVNPESVLPSLKRSSFADGKSVRLSNRMSVDGKIQKVYVEGNQVVVEYIHNVMQ
jgi:hypothetical protein